MFYLIFIIMNTQNDLPENGEKTRSSQTLGFWERHELLFNLRAAFGVIVGMVFFVWAMLFALKMEQYLSDDMEPWIKVELMVIFVVLMHLMTNWFWYSVLDKWTVQNKGIWFAVSIIAFVVFVATGAITFAAFVSEASSFFWSDKSDLWRVLPLVVALLSMGRMVYKVMDKDRGEL